jgi:sulfite exporter TauE/SafE/copper chaperone CopZ
MEGNIKSQHLNIGGMTCINCENHIREDLSKADGVLKAEVSYKTNTADVTYDESKITLSEIKKIIEDLDYQVLEEAPASEKKSSATNYLGIIVILFAGYTILRHFGLTNLINAFPQAEQGMGYGMLFMIGLLTSVHCVAMCGGINLSQCIPQSVKSSQEGGFSSLRPSLLYNAGRVISYTVIGGIVGALGSVLTLSGSVKGIVQIGAGIFMVIMGLNMLNVFPGLRKLNPHMPRFIAKIVYAEKAKAAKNNMSPLYVGLLNGLMPCGPLQAMQLYALSTGNPLEGALSMFLFSLGTVPLMFGLGALSSILSKKFTSKVMTIGAVLVVVLGISMFGNGLTLSGFTIPLVSGSVGDSKQANIVDGVQIVNTSLASGRYQPITVQAGIPVKWTITAEDGTINGCNNRMIIPEYNIEKQFEVGENVVEFTPKDTGTFSYSCWMGMIRSTITVVAQGEAVAPTQNSSGSNDTSDSSEDSSADVIQEFELADYTIPTDEVAIGEIKDGVQYVTIEVNDKGFTPAVVVLQAGLETRWTIKSSKAMPEKLLFPLYNSVLDVTVEEAPIYFYPSRDFEFSLENQYFGYVKVVDDLAKIDQAAIKEEVSNYQPTIWDYQSIVNDPSQGASCH